MGVEPVRRTMRPAEAQRAEIAMRLLITTERLERLATRLEAFVSAPPHHRKTRP